MLSEHFPPGEPMAEPSQKPRPPLAKSAPLVTRDGTLSLSLCLALALHSNALESILDFEAKTKSLLFILALATVPGCKGLAGTRLGEWAYV